MLRYGEAPPALREARAPLRLAHSCKRLLDLGDGFLADRLSVTLVDGFHGLAQARLLGGSQFVHLHAGLLEVREGLLRQLAGDLALLVPADRSALLQGLLLVWGELVPELLRVQHEEGRVG